MFKLPEQLVNDFVKATTDKPPKKTESFMYGTVHIDEGSIYVHLDGADEGIYTPCTTSVTVNEGDRVTIMLKNRQGVITSNLSKPTINTDYLEAGEARISGTIHAATYEDSTGNFTMDIGSEIPTDDEGQPIVDYSNPTFKIAGYVGADSNKKYLEIIINSYKLDIADLPQLNISASFRDSPTDQNEHLVGIGIGESGIQFYGEWPPNDPNSRVSSSIPWGKQIS